MTSYVQQEMERTHMSNIDENGVPVLLGIDGDEDALYYFVDRALFEWLHDFKVWKFKKNYQSCDSVDWDDLPF